MSIFLKASIGAYGAGRGLRNLAASFALTFGTFVAPLAAEEITIAALGDSLTQGYGLPVDQGFVPQLESWLLNHGVEVRVINAGVSGDTTAGGLARVGWTLTPDVDAMIVALGGNDMLRGIDPGVSRSNLAGILEVARMQGIRVLLVGLPAAPNYGPDYKADFDAIYPELAAEYGAALFPDFFTALRTDDEAAARAEFMQSDGIHPNAQGVSRIVAAIGPAVADLAAAELATPEPETAATAAQTDQ